MKKQKSLTLSGFKMVYFTNESKAPAIIFIHGNNLSKDVFNYQFEDPSLNRFNLIAIDLPGHGNSAVVNGDKKSFYTVPGMAGCINDFIKGLKIEEYILVGHSLGGHVAIESLENAVGCSGICIFQTPPAPKPIVFEQMFAQDELFTLIYQRDLNEGEMNTIAGKFVQDKDLRKMLYNMIKQSDPEFRQLFGESVASGNARDEVAILKSFKKPIAIFHGQNEKLVNLNYIEDLNINLWNNKIEMISNSGHCPQIENYKYFNFLLERFALECFNS